MRQTFLRVQLVLAFLVAAAVWLQVYFISSFFFGAGEGALDVHTTVGTITHVVEVVVFVTALGAWWRRWNQVALAFALGAIGTVQISLTSADGWGGGLHGLLALVILLLAVFIVKNDVEALGFKWRRDGAGRAPPPPPP